MIPEWKSQHFFNALDFIVTKKHQQGEYRYKKALLNLLYRAYLTILFIFWLFLYIILFSIKWNIKVHLCAFGGGRGHIFPSDQVGVS